MQLQKSGIRVMGIAESYDTRDISLLAGVVMRKDLYIDGFTFNTITVGGDDSSDAIISMFQVLNRRDISLIMISGCALAWFNILRPQYIYEETKIPVICVSYEESEGLDVHIKKHFPDDSHKIEAYLSLKPRRAVSLKTGYTLYARGYGITDSETDKACIIFTHHGKIPEPIRIARLCARSVMQYTHNRR